MADVSHYMGNGRECIDNIRDHMDESEYEGYLKGNVLKYLYRAGDKADKRRDLEKAADYACRLAYGEWLSDHCAKPKLMVSAPGDREDFTVYATGVQVFGKADEPSVEPAGSYVFNFPPNNRAGTTFDQLKHAAGEIVEAMEASSELGYITMLIEVLDAMECLEGVLRQSSPSNLAIAYERHYRKCRERGNYDVAC